MNCPSCNSYISFQHSVCDKCGEDLRIYKKIWSSSNHFYNDGLVKAQVRDLSGAIISLNKIFANGYNIKATTNKETPPYVKSAPDRTMARIALSFPSFVVINDAIDLP